MWRDRDGSSFESNSIFYFCPEKNNVVLMFLDLRIILYGLEELELN